MARNPQADSKLPYLVQLPLEGGLVLKARETWPSSARVYCHRFEEPWPAGRRGDRSASRYPAVAAGAARRSIWCWRVARGRGRSSSLRRCAGAARSSGRPNGPRKPPIRAPESRVAGRCASRSRSWSTRGSDTPTGSPPCPSTVTARRCPRATTASAALPANCWPPSSARRSRTSRPRSRTAVLPSRWDAWRSCRSRRWRWRDATRQLLTHAHAPAGWLADQLVRLQTRYPQVPVVFLDSRRHAEDWTHRFLATALTDRQAVLDNGATH